MNVIDRLGLRQDPFAPADSASGFGVAASVRGAHEEVMAAIARREPLIVVAGRPGMGKTLLLGSIERACQAAGLRVHRVARGDMAHTALSISAEVLLIDEADTITDATLAALAPGTGKAAAPMMVFAATRPALHRLPAQARPMLIDLRPLDPSEARGYLEMRAAAAGRRDLFEPGALDEIVSAGRGSPRLLRVLAGAAMFQAANDNAHRIRPGHASLAAMMHSGLLSQPEPEFLPPAAANDPEPPVPATGGQPALTPRTVRRPPRRGDGALPFAASVAIAALVLPVLFQSEPTVAPTTGISQAVAAQAVPGPFRLEAAPFMAPAKVVAPLAFAGGKIVETAAARPAPVVPPLIATRTIRLAAATPPVHQLHAAELARSVAAAREAAQSGSAASTDGRTLLVDLIAATRMQPIVLASRSHGGKVPAGAATSDAAPMLAALDPVDVPAPAVAASSSSLALPAAVASTMASAGTRSSLQATSTAVEQAATASDAARTAQGAKSSASSTKDARPTEAAAAAKTVADQAGTAKQVANSSKGAKEAANQAGAANQQAGAAKQAAEQAKAARTAAKQVAKAATGQAAASAKEVTQQAQAAKASAEQAKAAKGAADQASAAKQASEQASAVKTAAEQAKAARQAAQQAKSAKDATTPGQAAKDAAQQAKSARDAAAQGKSAKDAAEQAKSAKSAAEQAKSAKQAAEQAKTAKDAAEQAKAAKDAAEQAKAAKSAADQAQAAKQAAEQARAAKEAADQAKAAKDAAEQAKAAKEAADQAKAAKDAADQAKAAKEAADQAKAAKDAAEQAKAAKEAADQAKAAKDAAEQAKAAKDAAEQAKSAKDAAEQAKAAKDAAKAAKEAAKAAKDAGQGH